MKRALPITRSVTPTSQIKFAIYEGSETVARATLVVVDDEPGQPKYALLRGVWADPKVRGRGYIEMVVTEAIAEARRQRCIEVKAIVRLKDGQPDQRLLAWYARRFKFACYGVSIRLPLS